jgi:hypothetical protein
VQGCHGSVLIRLCNYPGNDRRQIALAVVQLIAIQYEYLAHLARFSIEKLELVNFSRWDENAGTIT